MPERYQTRVVSDDDARGGVEVVVNRSADFNIPIGIEGTDLGDALDKVSCGQCSEAYALIERCVRKLPAGRLQIKEGFSIEWDAITGRDLRQMYQGAIPHDEDEDEDVDGESTNQVVHRRTGRRLRYDRPEPDEACLKHGMISISISVQLME